MDNNMMSDIVINTITFHLIENGLPGYYNDGDEGCVYEAMDGGKCAIGCQIKSPNNWEGFAFQKGAFNTNYRFNKDLITPEFGELTETSWNFLSDVQQAHDSVAKHNYDLEDFRTIYKHQLKELINSYNLIKAMHFMRENGLI